VSETDDLFGLPLEEFTAARNALAKTQPEAKSIPKPTVPAWTVNQLARREPKLVRRLAESGEAQFRALQKSGSAQELRDAQVEERKAVAELVRKAAGVLEESGRSAAQPMLDRIAATLTAGAQTPEGREALTAGRLTEELEPAGFGALAGLGPIEPRSSGDGAGEKKARDDRRRRLREAQAEVKELDARAREAEREADRAEAAATKARAAATKARARADEAAEALADLA
jgi:hypothetical protein